MKAKESFPLTAPPDWSRLKYGPYDPTIGMDAEYLCGLAALISVVFERLEHDDFSADDLLYRHWVFGGRARGSFEFSKADREDENVTDSEAFKSWFEENPRELDVSYEEMAQDKQNINSFLRLAEKNRHVEQVGVNRYRLLIDDSKLWVGLESDDMFDLRSLFWDMISFLGGVGAFRWFHARAVCGDRKQGFPFVNPEPYIPRLAKSWGLERGFMEVKVREWDSYYYRVNPQIIDILGLRPRHENVQDGGTFSEDFDAGGFIASVVRSDVAKASDNGKDLEVRALKSDAVTWEKRDMKTSGKKSDEAGSILRTKRSKELRLIYHYLGLKDGDSFTINQIKACVGRTSDWLDPFPFSRASDAVVYLDAMIGHDRPLDGEYDKWRLRYIPREWKDERADREEATAQTKLQPEIDVREDDEDEEEVMATEETTTGATTALVSAEAVDESLLPLPAERIYHKTRGRLERLRSMALAFPVGQAIFLDVMFVKYIDEMRIFGTNSSCYQFLMKAKSKGFIRLVAPDYKKYSWDFELLRTELLGLTESESGKSGSDRTEEVASAVAEPAEVATEAEAESAAASEEAVPAETEAEAEPVPSTDDAEVALAGARDEELAPLSTRDEADAAMELKEREIERLSSELETVRRTFDEERAELERKLSTAEARNQSQNHTLGELQGILQDLLKKNKRKDALIAPIKQPLRWLVGYIGLWREELDADKHR